MLSTPRLIERPAQHYVAIPARVTMQSMVGLLPRLWPEVAAWLGARGIAPSGAPLIRWVVIDMAREMRIEVGLPVAKAVAGDGRVVAGTLPAGRYAVAVHHGHYNELVPSHAALQAWAAIEGLEWAVEASAAGDVWRARIESYTTDPQATPDPADWRTEIAYLVAAGPARPRARSVKRPAAKKPKRGAKRAKRAAKKPKRKAKSAAKPRRAAKSKRRTQKR